MVKRIANKLVDEETGEVLATEVTIAPIFWKTPYNHDTNAESDRTGLTCKEPTLTQQQFKEDADINIIMERALKTGTLPQMALPEHFQDLTGRTTYFEMASKTAEANAVFYKLDAKKRAEHQNDPTRWADAVMDALNRADKEGLENLGIDPKDLIQEPQTAPNPATPPASTPVAGPQDGPPGGPITPPTGA